MNVPSLGEKVVGKVVSDNAGDTGDERASTHTHLDDSHRGSVSPGVAEDSFEDGVYVGELAVVVEGAG
jgi:hypothetical protein